MYGLTDNVQCRNLGSYGIIRRVLQASIKIAAVFQLSGLVHISQICEKRIKKPSEVLAVGDKVKVKVTAIKDGKLSLSIKEASDMMAKEIEEEVYEVPDAGEEATTTLGSLFANIKLD